MSVVASSNRDFIHGLLDIHLWACVALVAGVSPGTANATPLPVDFTAVSSSVYGIGYNTGNPDFDQLVITSNSGSITLTQGLPQIVTISPFTFGVDFNSSYEELVTGLVAARSLTLNGVTHTITQPFQVAISYADTLVIFAGPTVNFDLGPGVRVEVTPLGVPFPPEGIGF